MPKNHMKRIAAPRSWNIKRKSKVWVVRAKGSHRLENSIPVAVLLRDMLKHAKSIREIKNILHTKTLLVNGKKVVDHHLGIGIMDIFEIPDLHEKYLILISSLGKMIAVKTNADFKVSKILGKKKFGRKTQLNLFGGDNILVEKDSYKTGDSVAIALKDKKIKEHLKFEEGANCFLTGGSHIGEFGKISKIDNKKVLIKSGEEEFETLNQFVYVTGKEDLMKPGKTEK